METETITAAATAVVAISAVLFTAATTFFCRKLSLSRKRPREEDDLSFEPASQRARLDDATTSENDPLAPEVVPEPLAPEMVPEPAAMVEGAPDLDPVLDWLVLPDVNINLDSSDSEY
jgi:hypothetical protein